MTIASAVYRDGVALTPDGAVYVSGLGTSAVPATAQGKGAQVPTGALKTDDGAICVRFV